MSYWGDLDAGAYPQVHHYGCQCAECKGYKEAPWRPHNRCQNCDLILARDTGDECDTCRLFTAQVAKLHKEPGRS